MSDREPERDTHRPRWPAAALVLGFFLVGALGATVVVNRLGLLNPSARAPREVPSAREVAPEPVVLPVAQNESVPPLAQPEPPRGEPGAARPPASAASVARVAVDVSPAHPRPGQPVDLVARVVGAKRLEGGSFQISGPGIAGADISAVADEAGVFRATFTFMEGGRFEVVFVGRADGAPVRGARAIQTGQAPLPPPPTAPTATTPAPPSSGGAKWL
jgi:hypothetical protein